MTSSNLTHIKLLKHIFKYLKRTKLHDIYFLPEKLNYCILHTQTSSVPGKLLLFSIKSDRNVFGALLLR